MTLMEAKAYAAKNVHNRMKVEGRLGGKIAVVTGGAQGFGYGLAEELYREGACVVVADLNEQVGLDAANRLGERACFVTVDVSKIAVNKISCFISNLPFLLR